MGWCGRELEIVHTSKRTTKHKITHFIMIDNVINENITLNKLIILSVYL